MQLDACFDVSQVTTRKLLQCSNVRDRKPKGFESLQPLTPDNSLRTSRCSITHSLTADSTSTSARSPDPLLSPYMGYRTSLCVAERFLEAYRLAIVPRVTCGVV